MMSNNLTNNPPEPTSETNYSTKASSNEYKNHVDSQRPHPENTYTVSRFVFALSAYRIACLQYHTDYYSCDSRAIPLEKNQQGSDTKKASMRSHSQSSASSASRLSQDQQSLAARTMDKAKSKIGHKPSHSERLSGEKDDLDKQKAKNLERDNRKADYDRLNLREQTIFGMNGAGGGWRSG